MSNYPYQVTPYSYTKQVPKHASFEDATKNLSAGLKDLLYKYEAEVTKLVQEEIKKGGMASEDAYVIARDKLIAGLEKIEFINKTYLTEALIATKAPPLKKSKISKEPIPNPVPNPDPLRIVVAEAIRQTIIDRVSGIVTDAVDGCEVDEDLEDFYEYVKTILT